MKPAVVLLAALLALFASAVWGQDRKEPDADTVPTRLTLAFEFIELDRRDWLAWIARPENSIIGPNLRTHVQELVKAGKAQVVHTAILSGMEETNPEIRSGGETIYPTEFDPPGVGPDGEKMTPPTPSSLETRHTGFGLEVSLAGSDSRLPDPFNLIAGTDSHVLELRAEYVERLRNIAIGRDNGVEVVPLFHALAHAASVRCADGETILFGTHRPNQPFTEGIEDPVVLTFVRLDAHALSKEMPGAAAANVEAVPDPTIGLLFEWIEVEQADLHRLVSVENVPLDGHELRKRIAGLIDAGQADIVEAMAAHTFPGERGRFESIEERIYRSEYDPPGSERLHELMAAAQKSDGAKPVQLPAMLYALETRPCGFTVETDCVLNPPGSGIDVHFSIEKVSFEGMRTWGTDESAFPVSDFHSAATNVQCRLLPGRSRLLSTHRLPKPFNPKRTDPRVLIFSRAEIDRGPSRIAGETPEPNRSGDCGIAIEIFETDRSHFNELLANEPNTSLRNALIDSIKQDTATSTDTLVLTARGLAKLESILEITYPSENAPAEISKRGKKTPAAPAALETRHTGTMLDVEGNTEAGVNLITGEFNLTVVTHLGEREQGQGLNRQEQPRFHQQQFKTPLSLPHGEPVFLGIFHPPAPEEKDTIRVAFIWGELADRTAAEERKEKKSN